MPLSGDEGKDITKADSHQDAEGFPFQRKSALPVPISRGAKAIRIAPLDHPSTDLSLTQRTTIRHSEGSTRSDRGPSCQSRAPSMGQTVPEQKCETSSTGRRDLQKRELSCKPQVKCFQSDDHLLHNHNRSAVLAVPIGQPSHDGRHPQKGSTSYLNSLNLGRNTPLLGAHQGISPVIDQPTPEVLCTPRKRSLLDREFSDAQQPNSSLNLGFDAANGRAESEVDKGRTQSGIPVQNLRRSHSGDSVDGVQHPRSKPTPPQDTVTIPPVSTKPGTADAAAVPHSLHQVGTSSGYHIRSNKGSSEPCMEDQCFLLPEQSHAQSCNPTTLQQSRQPEHLAAHLSDQWKISHPPTRWHREVDESDRTQCYPLLRIRTGGPERERERVPSVNEQCLDIQSPESDARESPPVTPQSIASSAVEPHETPMTSPSRSPTKPRPIFYRLPTGTQGPGQLDGQEGDAAEHELSIQDARSASPGSDVPTEAAIRQASSIGSGDDMFFDSHSRVLDSDTDSDLIQNGNDLSFPGPVSPHPRGASKELLQSDEFTPLVTPSFKQGATAFPFPRLSRNAISTSRRISFRHPSELLRHCEHNVTPRQKRLMTGGTRTPDRFIPSRAQTPTKESLILRRQRPKIIGITRNAADSDPFGALPARSLRMAEQYATTRNPPLPPRAIGVATRVADTHPAETRALSAGAIWTVGGTMVTEGVASTTNGRGGRVTSGTNAPHYAADFLRKTSPSEDEKTHTRRLAVAMNIEQNARMLTYSAPTSPASVPSSSASLTEGSRQWKDGIWQHEGVTTPIKNRTTKAKDVPVIPFRVLNAPALRDDYYCSLLSYSPTVQCLAVGLGPHVYLWSEKRTSTNIPDSLTAQPGTAHVTSVSFSSKDGESAILAIGRADGRITLWSPMDREPRFDSDQPSPVSCLCFRPKPVQRVSLRDSITMVVTEELLVGDEIGFVYYYSIEWPNQTQRDLFDWHGSMTLLARISCHSQQICGIAWSTDGQYFATGGNDNQLFVFKSKRLLRRPTQSRATAESAVRVRPRSRNSDNAVVVGQGEVLSITPGHERHVFALNAAVKAIAFAPWQSTLVAAGGGSNDRCIHFFHASSGSRLATIDCHAQVTSLVWSEKRKEVAGTFGFAQPEHAYRIAVFAWPSCNMVVRVPWCGEERALFAVAYPRGPSTSGQEQGGNNAISQRGGRRTGPRTDAEGRPWYGKRTREEGCLVVATSDASIKFHEIWAEQSGGGGGKRVSSGVFGGSQILEEEFTGDVERWGVIR